MSTREVDRAQFRQVAGHAAWLSPAVVVVRRLHGDRPMLAVRASLARGSHIHRFLASGARHPVGDSPADS
jgi:hypothetical protein